VNTLYECGRRILERMVSIELAQRLRDAGLRWEAERGDRFVITSSRGDESFVISDMTIEVHPFPTGRVVGFNGTTEWALDSVMEDETLWLPREDQLRTNLGSSFRRLERDGRRYRVVLTENGVETGVEAEDVEEAYGQALLRVLTAARAASS